VSASYITGFAFEDSFKMCKMSLGLKKYDKLEGASNFVPWNLRLQMLMEEANIWEHAVKVVPKPVDPTQLATHYKEEAKAKRIILDTMKDHLISHIAKKMTGKDMFGDSVKLFQTSYSTYALVKQVFNHSREQDR
jgi:hypothetical protein